jgi:hypothetical protein
LNNANRHNNAANYSDEDLENKNALFGLVDTMLAKDKARGTPSRN